VQNLHYSKHGVENWIVADRELHVLTNYDNFYFIGVQGDNFIRFKYDRYPMTEKEVIAFKGSNLLKQPEINFMDIKCHPMWWGTDSNFALLMPAD
jgi:hypothetical protein